MTDFESGVCRALRRPGYALENGASTCQTGDFGRACQPGWYL